MKITGKGGTILKDGVAIAGVVSFTFRETEGLVYSQTQSDITVNILSQSALTPFRHGDVFDVVLGVSSSASWRITLEDVEVVDPSIDVSRNAPVVQSINLIGMKKATIA